MRAGHSDQLVYAFSIILSLGNSCHLPRAQTSSLGFLMSSGCLRLKGDLLGVTLSPSDDLRFWSHYFPASNPSSVNCKFYAAAAAKSPLSCPTLHDPIDSSQPGSSAPGILQKRIPEWVAISFFSACMHTKSLQSCLILCNAMDSSPPSSSIHRILQARILEWVAISFSARSMTSGELLHLLLYSPAS